MIPMLVPQIALPIAQTGFVARIKQDGKTLDWPVVSGMATKHASDAIFSCAVVALDMATGILYDVRDLPGFVGIFPEKSAKQ
jgi:phosphohistidine swiveling domain-containing protein